MRELALHILDIAENSVSAQAKNITISVTEDLSTDRLLISIQDDGKGMDAQTVASVIDPFVTSRTTRKVGLGIPLLKEAAELCNGTLVIESTPGVGTLINVDFQRNHIDRMPLGNLADTYLNLLIAHPEVHWHFLYQVLRIETRETSGSICDVFDFDDQPIKETLEDLPLCDPAVLAYLRGIFEEGIAELQPEQGIIF
jgi:anti-sigma regulatory factor (Ser/Thr protein kinase)